MGLQEEVETLSLSLRKEVIECKTEPDIERSKDLLDALSKHDTLPVEILKKTRAGNTLAKCVKTLNRHKRTSSDKESLEGLITVGEDILKKWKEFADKQEKQARKKESEEIDKAQGLPKTLKHYHTRLQKQQKEIYKNPPVLPPDHIEVEAKKCSEPKRDKKTGELTFPCGEDDSIKSLLRDFHPNRTPEEIMRAGSFGGTYYRPIASAVTNKRYNADEVLRDSVHPKWIEGLDKKTMLVSSTYRTSVNKYGVKCGGSLGTFRSKIFILPYVCLIDVVSLCHSLSPQACGNPAGGSQTRTLMVGFSGTVASIRAEGARMTPGKFNDGRKVPGPKVAFVVNCATRFSRPKPGLTMLPSAQ